MGLGSTFGNIGAALADQRRRGMARTPTFLPPGTPIGPTPAAPPAPPPPPEVQTPDDTESYDYTKPPAMSPAMQVGGNIGQVAPGQPKYQTANDRLQQTLENPPERKKASIWRELGGNILMGTGSPVGMTLGKRLAYGDYPDKLAEHEANVKNQTLAAQQERATQEEQRKIEQNQNQTAESKARREDLSKTREGAEADRKATREFNEQKEGYSLLGTGQGRLYQAKPPQTFDVPAPAGVPGLAPTQATVPSPPKPANVRNIGGMDIEVGQKPKELNTAMEAALAALDIPDAQQRQQRLDEIAKANNVLNPQAPIHSFQPDDAGNVTAVLIDPRDPSKVQKIPLGPIGKAKNETVTHGSYTPILDAQGNITSFFNPATNSTVAPPDGGGRKTALSPTENVRRATVSNTLEDLEKLDQLSLKHQGVLGIISGPLNKAKIATLGGDPEVVDMFRTAQNLADQLLRMRSGAAITEGEYQRLLKLVPNASMPYPTFKATLDSYRQEMQRLAPKSTGGAVSPTGAMTTGGGGRGAPQQQPAQPARQAQPQPQQNPNPNGYVKGHVYGGLTYLGGDPNNAASWKQ